MAVSLHLLFVIFRIDRTLIDIFDILLAGLVLSAVLCLAVCAPSVADLGIQRFNVSPCVSFDICLVVMRKLYAELLLDEVDI